jgi:peptide-methionine (R)-S-oxide reductase
MEEEDCKKKPSSEQYDVLRCSATEAPFTGKYVHEKSDDTYVYTAWGNLLFNSKAKFDSGTGWASFFETLGSVKTKIDFSH